MNAPTIPILASIVTALAAGAWSVPSDHLRMQLQLRDHDLIAARASFERLSAQTEMSGTTLRAAAQLYRDLGEADRSIMLLHEYLERTPGDTHSRQLLAELYQEAGLLEPYLLQLETLGKSQPNATNLTERADLFDVRGDTSARLETLHALHALGAATPRQVVELAEHEAVERPSRAAQLLLEVDATTPKAMTMAHRKLLFALLEQQQRTSEAAALARRWYGSENVPENEALAFSSWLLRRGGDDLAAQILAAVVATSIDPTRTRSLLIDVRLRAGQRAEALALFKQWHRQGGVPESLVPVWAELVLEANDSVALNELLPALRQAVGAPNMLYAEHLYARALKQLDRRDELASVLESRLGSSQPQQRSEALSSLLDLDRKEPVVRHLRSEQGAQLPDAQQRQLAYRLLELGDKPVTIEAFMRLASDAGPDSDDVKMLLHLWGPRPDAPALDWLGARAQRADAHEQPAWLTLLLERGGAGRVAEILKPVATSLSPSQLKIYMQALVALERWEEVKPLLPGALNAATQAQELEQLAAWADRLDLTDISDGAWRGLLVHRPNDPDALLTLGLRRYAVRDFAEAVAFLTPYVAARDQDAQAHYFLAEALRETGRAREAALHYERTTETVPAREAAPARLRLMRALALNRLGRADQSVAELDQLHHDYPADRQVLEDYVGVLLENGQAAQARHVLERAQGDDRG